MKRILPLCIIVLVCAAAILLAANVLVGVRSDAKQTEPQADTNVNAPLKPVHRRTAFPKKPSCSRRSHPQRWSRRIKPRTDTRSFILSSSPAAG